MALPVLASLAAWTNAVWAGDAAPDDIVEALGPQRVSGVPGEPGPVTLPVALLRLRTAGAFSAWPVLSVAGDAGDLPGPADLTADAVAAGGAVVLTGMDAAIVANSAERQWSLRRCDPYLPNDSGLGAVERQLATAMREATEELVALDVAASRPLADAALDVGRDQERYALPPGLSPRAAALLERCDRLATALKVALDAPSAAVTARETSARLDVLRELQRATRRSIEAATGPAGRDR